MADWHVVVSGPLGVGKTTLASAAAGALGWACELESADANPFLADYYADPQRWGFHSQMFFMVEALAQQARVSAAAGGVIQDRVLAEHLAMFSAPKLQAGELTVREYELLDALVEAAQSALGAPDLLVYAHAPAAVILERIHQRSRDYEQHFTLAEVSAQCERYARFIECWKLCPVLAVDVSRLDARAPAGAQRLAELIRRSLGIEA